MTTAKCNMTNTPYEYGIISHDSSKQGRVHYGIPQIESSKKELAHEHQNIQILMILMSDNKM